MNGQFGTDFDMYTIARWGFLSNRTLLYTKFEKLEFARMWQVITYGQAKNTSLKKCYQIHRSCT